MHAIKLAQVSVPLFLINPNTTMSLRPLSKGTLKRVRPIYKAIVTDLVLAGKESPYTSDASESDPRYQSYGIRAPQVKSIVKKHVQAKTLSSLHDNVEERTALARLLIESGMGEQQSVALQLILEPLAKETDYFSTPEAFSELDYFMSHLYGWSKIDAYTCMGGALLQTVLNRHPEPILELAHNWNRDDNMWLRRASVVLFTRRVAKKGQYTDTALEMGERLLDDKEPLVLKGVGWMLKDMMILNAETKPRVFDYVKRLRRRGVSSTITNYAVKSLSKEERSEILAVKTGDKP